MSLNIKNEEVHRLAAELAQMTGMSMTAVVEEALQEKMEREQTIRQAKKETTLRALRKIMKDSHKALKGKKLPDHGKLLYDERGLPK